jgi:uncharacterized protein (DUF1501 family)
MLGTSFEEQYSAAADTVLKGTAHEAFDAVKLMKQADPTRYQPAPGANYSPSAFGQALKQIAQLAKSDVGLEIAFAETGNWDHHVNEGSTQGLLATRLDDFGRSLAALVTDLGECMSDTVIVTMSEFGRAVSENGNRGTDHGHGSTYWILGGGIAGGRIVGEQQPVAAASLLDNRDLPVLNDYRAVLGGLFTRLWGLTADRLDRVLPQSAPVDLGLV